LESPRKAIFSPFFTTIFPEAASVEFMLVTRQQTMSRACIGIKFKRFLVEFNMVISSLAIL